MAMGTDVDGAGTGSTDTGGTDTGGADGGGADRGLRWWQGAVEADLEGVPRDELTVVPAQQPVDYVVRPPGSKSVTNRVLVCAALCDGPTVVDGVLLADDTIAMLDCLAELGIAVAVGADRTQLVVAGGGGVRTDAVVSLDARLSGTTARFMAPVAALLAHEARLDGGQPLQERPMGELVAALRDLGADIEATQPGDRLPMTIHGSGLVGGSVEVSGDVSSQFLSALLLSAPAMPRGLEVYLTTSLVSRPYVDMTTSVMESFGAHSISDGDHISVPGDGYRSPGAYSIEPDASAASYFLAAAAIRGGRARIEGLDRSSMQGDIGLVEILERMGMEVIWGDGWVQVVSSGSLRGVDVDMSDMSDVAQTLAVVATCAGSPTRVRGIGFIRGKETDRISAVVTELRRLGIVATEEDDGFTVHPGTPNPGLVHTYDDHRMAMSFALLGLVTPGIRIADPRCVAKTYPRFWHDLEQTG